jgi:hypothetical protein
MWIGVTLELWVSLVTWKCGSKKAKICSLFQSPYITLRVNSWCKPHSSFHGCHSCCILYETRKEAEERNEYWKCFPALPHVFSVRYVLRQKKCLCIERVTHHTITRRQCSNRFALTINKLQIKTSVEQRVTIVVAPHIMATWLVTLYSLTIAFKIMSCMVFGHRRNFKIYKTNK